jgi:ATP-dependent helicase/nuclease subunit B
LEIQTTDPAREWAQTLDHPAQVAACARPAPTPPVSARPRKLSVSRIETWLNDPYSVYAGSILKLSPLSALEQQPDAAQRGSLLHDIFAQFVTRWPREMPPDPVRELVNTAYEQLGDVLDNQGQWNFWLRRFQQIARAFVNFETQRCENYLPVLVETPGRACITVNTLNTSDQLDFILTARADRIDQSRRSGGYAILDYKSGGSYSRKGLANGKHPQLALEGAILQLNGFQGLNSAALDGIALVTFGGGEVKIHE